MLPFSNLYSFLFEKLLKVLDVRRQGVLLALELAQVASPLRAASYPIGNIAFNVLLRAVRATIRKRITANLAHLLNLLVRRAHRLLS